MIYANVKALAKKRGMPLYVVEQKAGLSSGTITRWKSIQPRVSSLQAVAKVLDVTVNTLLRVRDENTNA